MGLCKKKVKDTNPCSPTYGLVFTRVIPCPKPQKPKPACTIPIFSVGINQTSDYQNCTVLINSVDISLA